MNCISLLHANSLLKLAQQSTRSQQFALLNQLFVIIEDVICKNETLAMSYKIAADGLMLSWQFHVRTFKNFSFPSSWAVLTRTDALTLASRFYCVLVKMCPKCGAYWNDLGLALTMKSKITKESSLAIKSVFNNLLDDLYLSFHVSIS